MPEKIFPPRLHPGDEVALIAPAFSANAEQIEQAVSRLQALKLRVNNTVSGLKNDGYFASDAQTIVDIIHEAFANPRIRAIVALRGGYGCARLLPKLDWNLIKSNPKIVLGYSDLTSLLNSITHHTGLITFHGPSASTDWPQFTQHYLRDILFSGKPVRFEHQSPAVDDVITHPDEIKMLRAGIATGELIGGNLTVFTSLLGSSYLPTDWSNKILFLEDVNEDVYRLDRQFMQLKLANILQQVKGLLLGQFNRCPMTLPGSFTVMQLLTRLASELNIPILANMAFGHQPHMFTFPIGATVHLDANQALLELQSPAVQ